MSQLYRALVSRNIVKEGHFILRSGKHSDKYISKDRICIHPNLYADVLEDLIKEADHIREEKRIKHDMITSPAVAGICFGSPVAYMRDMPFVYPEKVMIPFNIGSAKGKKFKMEYRADFKPALEGRKVLLIEDIITTGVSSMKTIEAVQECGGEVVAVLCIWNRSPKHKPLTYFLSGGKEIPNYSLISEPVESWEPGECPLCKEGVKLFDPKTNTVVEG